jgi:predicted TPR repeat methyltransferase
MARAVEHYERAITQKPDYADAHRNLANVLSKSGRHEEAVESYRRALAVLPGDADSHLGLGFALENMGELSAAAESYRQAVRCRADVAALGRLGQALRRLGRLEEARQVYAMWTRLEPRNPVPRHLLAACQPDGAPPRAENDYVKATFDRFANSFDQSLSHLNYRAPALIAAAVARYVAGSARSLLNVLDLGCGTGLCGPHLRPLARRLVGVDLSAAMLVKAAERNVYDELIEAELTEFLQTSNQQYDLIVAADTLVYIGQLEPVWVAAHHVVYAGGHLVFTVEKLDDTHPTPYQLNRFGRYSHSEAGLRQGLEDAGFHVCGCHEEVLRHQHGEAVIGLVLTALRD